MRTPDLQATIDGKSIVLIDDPQGRAHAALDPQAAAPYRIFRVALPPHGKLLKLTERSSEAVRSWSLRLEPADPLLETLQAIRTGTTALARIAELRATSSPDPLRPCRAAALRRLEGRALARSGQKDQALTVLGDAVESASASGCLSEATIAAAIAVRSSIEDRNFAAAEKLLARVRPLAEVWPEGAAEYLYYETLVSRAKGNHRLASTAFAEARARAAILGVPLAREVAHEYSIYLREIGKLRASIERMRELLTVFPGGDPCERAHLLSNLSWAMALERELGEGDDDILPLMNEALQLHENECPSPETIARLRVNLALEATQRGRAEEARRHLAEVNAVELDAPHEVWRTQVEGRIALLESRPREAIDIFQRLERFATLIDAPELRWRAVVGRGEALDSLGRLAEAVLAYQEAERVLADRGQLLPATEGLFAFFGDRPKSARLLVDLLVRENRVAEAMAVARRARRRGLIAIEVGARLAALSPEQRAAWDRSHLEYLAAKDQLAADGKALLRLTGERKKKLHAEIAASSARSRRRLNDLLSRLVPAANAHAGELPNPKDGELLLLWFPGRDSAWIGFAKNTETTTARSISSFSDPGALLEPFAEEIAAAKQVRLLPVGRLAKVDIHAHAALENKSTVYALDLPAQGSRKEAKQARALIVGAHVDPSRPLPHAASEAAFVAETLAARRVAVDPRIAPLSARALRAALAEVDHFHYAGHGAHDGGAGWDTHLRIGTEERFEAADILLLEGVPRSVVLSGCKTGLGSIEGHESGISLAQAFLLRGAELVIATDRDLKDRAALDSMRRLYTAWSDDAGDADLAELEQKRAPGFRTFVR